MNKVSVDLLSPSPYVEPETRFHQIKRGLGFLFAFRLIKKIRKKARVRSVLEIGTGSGYFLKFCQSQFPHATLVGIEYDERLLQITRQRAPAATCFQGNAELFDLSPRTFDVIVSFQVIEHLYDPSAMIRRVKKHLAPGGLFIVTSPNLSGLGARFERSDWHAFRSDHVSLKSTHEWVRLIESHGFKASYVGSTFFTGIPFMNRFPLGLLNWGLLAIFGSLRWSYGESFVGAFIHPSR